MEVNKYFSWRLFEVIHGSNRPRVLWVGIPCLLNGYKNGMVLIMPANPFVDIGSGNGNSIWIEEDEISYHAMQ